ncbi:MAG: hypothetical protein Kow0031_05490 [Anaerolineae bacterium]
MTRTAAATFTVVLGFVLVGLMGVVFLLLFPYEQLIAPASTPTLAPTPLPTATPTIQSFLPTARPDTPTPAAPPATNTRVPTVTPAPTKTPAPPFSFPTRVPPRPTSTPEIATAPAPGTAVPTATLPPQRAVEVQFSADPSTIKRGKCTDLVWQVSGPVTVQLEGEAVPPSGRREVCPSSTRDYTLTVQVVDSAELFPYQVRVNVS